MEDEADKNVDEAVARARCHMSTTTSSSSSSRSSTEGSGPLLKDEVGKMRRRLVRELGLT